MHWKGLIRLLKLVLILSILLGLGYLTVFQTDWFLIKGFEVQANADRRPWIEENFKRYYVSRNTFLVSLEEGADSLRADPSVRRVEIKRKLPGTLVYHIDYRIAVAGFEFEDITLMVDRDGYLVSTANERPKDVPLISGLKMDSFVTGKPVDTLQKQQLKVMLDLVTLLGSAGLEKECSMVMGEQTVLVTLKSGLCGRFWYRGSMEDSFNRFITVYNDQIKKGVTSGLIDVSSEGYPVYKPFGE